jgi:hypothetical protein
MLLIPFAENGNINTREMHESVQADLFKRLPTSLLVLFMKKFFSLSGLPHITTNSSEI